MIHHNHDHQVENGRSVIKVMFKLAASDRLFYSHLFNVIDVYRRYNTSETVVNGITLMLLSTKVIILLFYISKLAIVFV